MENLDNIHNESDSEISVYNDDLDTLVSYQSSERSSDKGMIGEE